MGITVFATQNRDKAALETIEPGRVRMYVCGPTVYDSCHIGHARPAVVFDTIRRYLEYSGLVVTFISNITDIDDKIINRSRELGISWRDLVHRYQDEYEQDMAALGVLSPTIRPRATEHIPEMIELVKGLVEKGVAYATPKGVWFDVAAFKDYGRLSGRTLDEITDEESMGIEYQNGRLRRFVDSDDYEDLFQWSGGNIASASYPSEGYSVDFDYTDRPNRTNIDLVWFLGGLGGSSLEEFTPFFSDYLGERCADLLAGWEDVDGDAAQFDYQFDAQGWPKQITVTWYYEGEIDNITTYEIAYGRE